MDSAALIIAIAGLLTTAAAPIVQGIVSARNQTRAWKRDARAQVYTEALTRAQFAQQLADAVTYEYFDLPSAPKMEHSDLITARLRLVGPKSVHDAWCDFDTKHEALVFDLNENYPELGANSASVMSAEDPGRLALIRAIDGLRQAIQKAFG